MSSVVMRRTIAAVLGLAPLIPISAQASELKGPARFCGYSPIIDLLPSEKVTTLSGGIHGGSFRWEGPFGHLDVYGAGWASRPKGRILKAASLQRPARFAQRKVQDVYQIAIWNHAQAAAYFTSATPFTPAQLAAIDRVSLFQEGEKPEGCKLRTIFVWE